ncbi:MAG: DUF4124 domain-containing protein [Gammaproteobacteria bacterium HGW-Gammaproteobacteria-11]|nr:MAG: DUF4124 domain-containing protein [Gammaproteobacteria bacterium HGW-Gammaproteobacteria-11]
MQGLSPKGKGYPGMLKQGCWLIILLCTSLALQAQTAQLYRYVDNNGVTVLDNRVPPDIISRGYEIIDSQGRVKEVIPAAPTPEELQAMRDARAEQERQQQADMTLLRLYSSVGDLDRARDRQIFQIENLILTSKSSIDGLQVQREELQRRAAVQERAGREVDEQILKDLADVDAETRRLERLISSKQLEIQEVNEHFAAQKERLSFLLSN